MTEPSEPMTLAAFDDALLRYGSDLARWPEDARDTAERLLAESHAARQMLADERALTETTAAALAVTVHPARLAARVEAGIDARRNRWSFAALFRPFPIAVGAAGAVACGAAIAWILPVASSLDPDALLMTALGGGLI